MREAPATLQTGDALKAGIPATASRGQIILASCSRLERLRYSAEQAILDWRDASLQNRPQHLLVVRDAQQRISRAKFRNAHLAVEVSARSWVDNWEPRSA